MPPNVYRGLEIIKRRDGYFCHQETHAKKVIATYNMSETKPANHPIVIFENKGEKLSADVPYHSAIGFLAHLADTRPNRHCVCCKSACPQNGVPK